VAVTVELFGIPRERAGVAKADATASTLGEMLALLALRFPRFAESCVRDGELAQGYVANLNGRAFITDPATVLSDGDAVLILSADAGG
jgi:molybdopterin converting factor small subunit